jgi:putative transposase
MPSAASGGHYAQTIQPVTFAMLVMTGRVTMLGMSRWAGKGGSYRTVQRFFYTKAIPWATLFWVFFQRHLHCSDHRYLLAGDEVVVTKAGKETYGLDRFYSSLYGKPVPDCRSLPYPWLTYRNDVLFRFG